MDRLSWSPIIELYDLLDNLTLDTLTDSYEAARVYVIKLLSIYPISSRTENQILLFFLVFNTVKIAI